MHDSVYILGRKWNLVLDRKLKHRFANLLFASVVGVIATIVVSAAWRSPRKFGESPPLAVAQSPQNRPGQSSKNRPGRAPFLVTVNQPLGPPMIELVGTDPQGRSGSVACSTCHSVRPADLSNRTPETLDEFHRGLTVDHGKIACYACHHLENADALRLADGTTVEYENVMTLCSQCHGPQATAFAHGAHGGMNGHWDLSRGPQHKNNCIDCHDPHSPSYPKMIVGFKPRDRFLDSAHAPSNETRDSTPSETTDDAH
ncbi:hypothetical protein [Novipirellula artificiosorum]|uniref:Doubled CXXCH motif n=1 Tax=Novipirellula artificiosorum TaxID=2528016 RepID=A0A5C6DND8_9BACT|nr:hypothetical protein [Novipirellula artificiosorum]TWU37387.1 Doubled CXXCH motif [Novipirellula artificiosorum]